MRQLAVDMLGAAAQVFLLDSFGFATRWNILGSRCLGFRRLIWARSTSAASELGSAADILVFAGGSKLVRVKQLNVRMFGLSYLNGLQWLGNYDYVDHYSTTYV